MIIVNKDKNTCIAMSLISVTKSIYQDYFIVFGKKTYVFFNDILLSLIYDVDLIYGQPKNGLTWN